MNKKQQNEVENKKAFTPFVIIMILSTILGGIVGALGASGRLSTIALADVIGKSLILACPYIILIITLGLLFIMARPYQKLVKEFHNWDGENEDMIDAIEKKLSIMLAYTSLSNIIGFACMGFLIYNFVTTARGHYTAYQFISYFFGLACAMFMFLYDIYAQAKIVDLTKEINPEKQGSVYDFKFQKKWIESSDEAEMQITYKSAFQAFKVLNGLCLALILIFCVGNMFYPFGLVPIFTVAAIWFVMVFTSCKYCTKNGK